ncbi:MAG: hypothetical protein ABW277_25035 [Longimicrobiaceae bacterium]
MTPVDPVVPVDVLREAAQRRVDDTSLRIAAGEIGVSYSGLRTFLKGTDPYAPTLAKLRAWYAQTVEGRAMTPERARAMLAALVESMPLERREEAVRELVTRLVESYRKSGADVPGWLARINK